MKIEIDVPRPGFLLTLLAAVLFGSLWVRDSGFLAAQVSPEPASAEVGSTLEEEPVMPEGAAGGDALLAKKEVQAAEDKLQETRSLQEILSHKEEYLRYQLQLLQQEREKLGDTVDPDVEEQFRQSTLALTSLLQDQKKAEQYVLSSLNGIWQTQGKSPVVGEGTGEGSLFRGFAYWPVNPEAGISAKFHDAEYRKIFPFEHDAIDIRVPQGTVIRAPMGGKVIEVKDQNGLGFNYLRIQHADGVVTLYGHITDAMVREGDEVSAGQPIAHSGGMPGSKGAGAFTTGPHLHFRLDLDGVPVDPTKYLPGR